MSVEDLIAVFHNVYDVAIDDEITRNAFASGHNETPETHIANTFSTLRKQYRSASRVQRLCVTLAKKHQ